MGATGRRTSRSAPIYQEIMDAARYPAGIDRGGRFAPVYNEDSAFGTSN
ncbi:MAG: hypothetical protein HFH61_04820 [Lachnospiraceae bacterium]|nr:hypothetical protein [Lachnospiraceae bacterium]